MPWCLQPLNGSELLLFCFLTFIHLFCSPRTQPRVLWCKCEMFSMGPSIWMFFSQLMSQGSCGTFRKWSLIGGSEPLQWVLRFSNLFLFVIFSCSITFLVQSVFLTVDNKSSQTLVSDVVFVVSVMIDCSSLELSFTINYLLLKCLLVGGCFFVAKRKVTNTHSCTQSSMSLPELHHQLLYLI